MKKIVFLLQNGIGFGHFKLALTVAQCFDKEEYEIIFITQAKSTRIFEGYEYKVINIPPTYSLKSNNEVLWIHTFVDKLIRKINPTVVIEDTYPDEFYLNLPSLQFVPKILIVNRLVAVEFENYYFNGILEQYDKVIVLKNKSEFLRELTSIEVKNFVNYSDKIDYSGNVFNEPSSICCEKIKEKYELTKYKKNVVVNCGAGGWHIGENICRTIFEKIIAVGNELCSGYEMQIIILLGPYSSYIIPELQQLLHENACVKMIDFEDHSDALFHEADLVILRPGYNSTMEALAGRGEVILLPGISYLESQEEWCEILKEKYGSEYLPVDDIDRLPECVAEVLNSPKRKKEKVNNHSKDVMGLIVDFLNKREFGLCQRPFIAIKCSKVEVDTLRTNIHGIFKSEITFYDNDSLVFKKIKIPVINNGMKYHDFKDLEVVAAIQDEMYSFTSIDFFETRYSLSNRGVIVVPIIMITIGDVFSVEIEKIKYLLSKSKYFNGCICLNISESLSTEEVIKIIEDIHSFFTKNDIQIIDLKSWLTEMVKFSHEKHQYNHYRPEITKLS